ncbi:MAG TPA: NADH-quinone oxidoreductase subunit NuoG, partial [Gammaproteobacteria bacterium]|nr:NADH-quinone oxidoreductase subunit NuoG [Gammaproteobacteria bacterium]
MSDTEEKLVNLEINGTPVQARPGQMIIEATDAAEVYVPRFCYHRKLSIAANCRMCLIDVEKAPKPLPACATPVAEGMKVFTRSKRALSAQKATMEFLLINHPLDCPICDQGGECELQDLAMGFGRGVSRYTERKRVVKDKNLGSLVSTDMTRCIHCTRCVRFGEEIAGFPTLGTVGRGETMEIGTYIEQSIDHEMSGNIIDLCPVGALNNKPFRFNARAWEMTAHALVSPHDCAGSNMYAHVLRDRVRRVVPRDNDAINDTWLADRDRFSCHAIDAPDRLREPQIKRDGKWVSVDWKEALEHAAGAIVNATTGEGSALGVLAGPGATLEEYHLLRRIADALGTRNIDHRLRRRDFTDQENDERWPWLGCSVAELATRDAVLLLGCDIRAEAPILAHQLRKGALAGTSVAALNPARYEYHFPVSAYSTASLEHFTIALAGVTAAAHQSSGGDLPKHVEALIGEATVTEEHRALVTSLAGKSRSLILLGQIVLRHPAFATLRVLASALADLTGATLGVVPEGCNSVGAALAGVLPHREPGGGPSESRGLDAFCMVNSPRRVYLLHGFEPDADTADPLTVGRALQSADHVIALTPFAGEALRECADVLLPVGTFAETPGTFVNAEGNWQSF